MMDCTICLGERTWKLKVLIDCILQLPFLLHSAAWLFVGFNSKLQRGLTISDPAPDLPSLLTTEMARCAFWDWVLFYTS